MQLLFDQMTSIWERAGCIQLAPYDLKGKQWPNLLKFHHGQSHHVPRQGIWDGRLSLLANIMDTSSITRHSPDLVRPTRKYVYNFIGEVDDHQQNLQVKKVVVAHLLLVISLGYKCWVRIKMKVCRRNLLQMYVYSSLISRRTNVGCVFTGPRTGLNYEPKQKPGKCVPEV